VADEDDVDVRVEGGRGGAEGDLGVDDALEEPVAQAGDGDVEGAAGGVGGVDSRGDGQVRQGVG